jgi:hypothetical protein
MIDKNSATWKSIEKFVEHERRDCIQFLIADRDSEKQRGSLMILEKLENLADSEEERERASLN